MQASVPPAHEGEPLEQEGARLLHATRVRAPVLQAVVAKVSEDVQTLGRRDVPVTALLDFCEEPRLHQSTPGE